MTDQPDIFKTISEFDALISHLTSDQIIMEVLHFLDKRLHLVSASVNLLTPDGSGFTPVVIDPEVSEVLVPSFIPVEVTHLIEIININQPIYRPDISNHETKYAIDHQLTKLGLKSDFVVPLKINNELIGTLNYGSEVVNGIDEDTRQLLILVASRLSYALHVARLLEQTQLSEKKFRDIYEHSLAAIYTFNRDKNFIDSNQAGLDLLGYSRDELLQMHISEVDAKPKEVLPAHKELLSGNSLSNFEHQLRREDGRIITVLNNSIPLYDGGGNLTGMQSYLFDITERRLSEEAQRIRRELALDALQITDIDKIIRLCTSAAIRIAGVDSGGFYLFDETSGDLQLRYSVGLGEDLVRTISHYSARSVNADLVRNGKTVFLTGTEMEAILPPPFREEGIRSAVTIPFRNDDRVVGCINIASHEHTEVPTVVREDLDSLSLQVSSIINRVLSAEKLQRSVSKYRHLFEQTSDGILISNQEGVITDANEAGAVILGYDGPGDLVGTNVLDHYAYPEDRAGLIGQLDNSNSFSNLELNVRHRDGSLITVLASVAIERDRKRNLLRGSFIFTDISESKQAETALRKSEELFRTIAYFNYDWEYWIDQEGKFRYISPSVERITGYSPDEFTQDPDLYRRIVHPDDLPGALSHRHQVSDDGNLKPILFRITHRDGNEHWISHHCVPVVSNQGENLGRRGSNRDVTEQIKMEQALKESEARFRNLTELLPQPVVETDLGGKPAYANQKAFEAFRYDKPDLAGIDSITEMVIPEDRKRVFANIAHRVAGENLEGNEYTGLRKDGTTFPIILYTNIIREAGEPKGIRIIVVDLSVKS